MNIFVLSTDPAEAAEYHCDQHVVKMILEYAQLLSTAHRLLDGTLVTATDNQNRKKPKKFWLFDGEHPHLNSYVDDEGNWTYKWIVLDPVMYQVAHQFHPCSVWARQTTGNYRWLYALFDALLTEFEYRYDHEHSAARLRAVLQRVPANLPDDVLTPFARAMPEEYKHENVVEAYHRFYVGSKARFAKWTNRDLPKWFQRAMEGQDVSVFQRTR